jgi:hypothetical protein
MATNYNDEPTEPDAASSPQVSPLGPTIPWVPNAAGAAGAQQDQTIPYNQTVPYPGPYAPPVGGTPTVADPSPAPPFPAPQQWPGTTYPYAPPVVYPRPAPVVAPAPTMVAAPAVRVATRSRPAPSAPVQRVWRLLPLPHILLGIGFILLLAALNIPWGATADGTLVYPQSFPIPFFSDQPDAAGQLAQAIVTTVGMFSLALAGMNYLLMFLNWLVRPIGAAGCATVLLMPLMITLMFVLFVVDGGALIFGAFDPLAGVALAPWQQGFTLTGPHAEIGYYAWYTGVILNAAGMFTQPFVRR